MGMDVIAKRDGVESFHASVWSWHPLWTACAAIAPGICSKVRYAHSNDGDGLNWSDSLTLAEAIDAALAVGSVEQALRADAARREALRDETCQWCDGTGTRNKPIPGRPDEVFKPGDCNGCRGTGRVRPFETHYSTDVEELRAFSAFLRLCGGFEIW